jgi:dTDP-4-dehydrorhamnose 3,5-epimerase
MSYTAYQPTEELKITDGLYRTKFDGLFYVTYPRFADNRGVFSDFFKIPKLNPLIGLNFTAKQVNFSYSYTGVIRGMHAEGWNKMVTILNGKALCVEADIRPESPTFGQTEYFEIGFDPESKQGAGLIVKKGIANSICALEGPVSYLYVVDSLYEDRDIAGDQAVSIYDPDLNISWPFTPEQTIISDRDKQAVTLREKFPQKFQK